MQQLHYQQQHQYLSIAIDLLDSSNIYDTNIRSPYDNYPSQLVNVKMKDIHVIKNIHAKN